ncbi:MAG: hypothetical protein JWQ71_3374 [Pedosphaera sp.]|nr:hypothetical protein [Pedosphaera sp.]
METQRSEITMILPPDHAALGPAIAFSQRKEIPLDEPHPVRQPPTTAFEAPKFQYTNHRSYSGC